MKCMIVVLAVASLCLAEPEADPLHYYAPYFYRPYAASGYAGPLPGHSFQSVHRLHKREAEADAQFAGPLTPAFGDAVATPRGLESLALNGFSEDLNMDGFVDPVAQAVPAPVVAPLTFAAPAPVVAAAPAVAAPAPLTVAAPAVTALNALPAAAPIFHSAPLAAPFAAPFAAPVAAVAHAPVVKSVVEAPAVVNTEVHAAPLFHHAPLVHSFASAPVVRTVNAPALAPVALSSTDCVTPGGCAVKSALLTGAPTGAFAHVTSSLVKREAEAEAAPEADAEADADAYYYGHYGYNAYAAPYAYNPFYNYFGAYSGYYNPYNYNAYAAYAPYAAAPVAAPAPVVAAAPAPLVAAPAPVVKSVTRPVTYTHIGAHPVAPTTVLETETFV